MTNDTKTCRHPRCSTPVGQQDRGDYRSHRYCSVQCDVKHDHIKADARDARREPDPEVAPGREP